MEKITSVSVTEVDRKVDNMFYWGFFIPVVFFIFFLVGSTPTGAVENEFLLGPMPTTGWGQEDLTTAVQEVQPPTTTMTMHVSPPSFGVSVQPWRGGRADRGNILKIAGTDAKTVRIIARQGAEKLPPVDKVVKIEFQGWRRPVGTDAFLSFHPLRNWYTPGQNSPPSILDGKWFPVPWAVPPQGQGPEMQWYYFEDDFARELYQSIFFGPGMIITGCPPVNPANLALGCTPGASQQGIVEYWGGRGEDGLFGVRLRLVITYRP